MWEVFRFWEKCKVNEYQVKYHIFQQVAIFSERRPDLAAESIQKTIQEKVNNISQTNS